MKDRIEATGNTKEEAERQLALRRSNLEAKMNVYLGEVKVFGNFELGYKLVQEFDPVLP